MSAIAGGVTLVVDQPNTIPPITNSDTFIKRVNEATEQSYCNFAINAAVHREVNIKEMWEVGAMAFGEIFISPSQHGLHLTKRELNTILIELSRIGALATIHAEEVPTIDASNLDEHDLLHSIEDEEKIVGLVSTQKRKDQHIHICHCSAPHAIDGIQSSVEVTPHHLLLSIEQFNQSDGRGKANPPLRHEWVREALWSKWQHIDVIASDHAPPYYQ
jgi:dihydroorotase